MPLSGHLLGGTSQTIRVTRTAKYKLRYMATFAALLATALVGMALAGWTMPAVVIVSLVLLIPGRLQGHFYRDLFTGRRALEAGDLDASRTHTERFLTTIREKPGLKSLIWLGGVVYTADPEAMALNNLGAAHMEAGRLDAAESGFRGALDVDPLYPIPLSNLAVLSEVKGDRTAAERYLREAEEQGYTGSNLDRVMI